MAQKKKKPARKQARSAPPTSAPKSGKSLIPAQWQPAAWLAIILVFTGIAMSGVLSNDFVLWDDDIYVTENEWVIGEKAPDLGGIFDTGTFVAGNYHPLTVYSLALDHQAGKRSDGTPRPSRFHSTNFMLHLANTALVFMFLFLLTKGNLTVSGITALFFGIHPMHVEPVAWISGRKEVLYALFFLASIVLYLIYLKKQNYIWLGISFLLFIPALLSKPSAVILPVVLILIDYFKDREWKAMVFIEKLPYFLLAIWGGWMTIQAQSDIGAIAETEVYSFWERIVFSSAAFANYWIRSIVPSGLAAYYPYPSLDKIPGLYYAAPVFFLGVLGLIAWLFIQKRKALVFGISFLLINVVLVLQFVSVGSAMMADRYTYIAYIGAFFMLALGIEWLWSNGQGVVKYAGPIVTVVLVLAWTVITQKQIATWENTLTLWTNVLDKYPDRAAMGYNNRGLYYKEKGQFQNAVDDYSNAIRIAPNNHLAWNSRGNIYREMGYSAGGQGGQYYEQSLKDLSKAIELKPDHIDSYNSRGLTYLDLGDLAKAEQDFNRTLELDPEYSDAYLNRAGLFMNQGKLDEAMVDLQKYLEKYPNDTKIVHLRGVIHYNQGRFEDAVKDFDRVIEMDPSNGSFFMTRAMALDTLGLEEKALNDAKRARSLGMGVEDAFLQKLENEIASKSVPIE